MDKFSKFIVKNKLIIIGIILLLTIGSIVSIFYVNVNSDLFSYLPDDMAMSDGITYMQNTFNMQGDAILGIEGVNYDQMTEITGKIQQFEHKKKKVVKEGGVIWIGMFEQMRTMDFSSFADMADNKLLPEEFREAFKKDMEDIKDLDMNAVVDTMIANPDILKLFYPQYEQLGGKYDRASSGTYVVMLQLKVQTSSPEALNLVDFLNKELLKDVPHAVGGSVKLTKDVMDSTLGEAWKYILVAVLVMFIVLLLTTTSLVEPFIFMFTLGISLVLNLGTNIIFPSVSVITFAASSILQLGLSMDYAIFLMHAYTNESTKTLNKNLAMQNAISKTFVTVLASALTTVGGFLALFFMKFTIGADLGMVLAKGVILSMLTVLLLQPSLMLWTTKIHKKTQHRIYLPQFKVAGSYSVTHRKTIVSLALLLIVPTVILQSMISLSYIKFTEPPANPTQVEQIVMTMNNSVIVIVPADNIENNNKFLEKVKKIENVQATMGIYDMMPDEFNGLISTFARLSGSMDMSKLDKFMPSEAKMLSGFINKGKTMYSILLNCPEESDQAIVALNAIKKLCVEYFSPLDNDGNTVDAVINKDYYLTGSAQAVEDLKSITPKDFNIVNIMSVLIILIVLIFALKSIKLPVLLIALIELGIFINISICVILGQQLNFMAYIIISSIQLGATVDYAILYTMKYKENLEKMPSKEAAYRALMESGNSILTSVALMGGCTLSVSLVTSNRIVSEICLMIARGAVISGILVILVLPALLVLFTGNKRLRLSTKTLAKLNDPASVESVNTKKKRGKSKPQRRAVLERNLIDYSLLVQDVATVEEKATT